MTPTILLILAALAVQVDEPPSYSPLAPLHDPVSGIYVEPMPVDEETP